MKRFIISLLLLVCTGCANYQTVTESATEQEINEQVALFDNLYIGQSSITVKERIKRHLGEAQRTVHSFEHKEKDKTYRYKMIYNTQTHIEFGLYFEDEKLKSLIIEQDAKDVFACISQLKTRRRL